MATSEDIDAFAAEIVSIEQFAPGEGSAVDKAKRAAQAAVVQGDE